MASSSSRKSYKYDVFLSFRGEDTRKNFVDHLYDALKRQGINCFKDDERLEKGKGINEELLKSIEESKYFIVVFSKTYASSSWCLDELVKIMECQKATEQIAYPVFYDVDPSEVRKQDGLVGEAFARHENKGQAGKWREALEKAASLSGWDLSNTYNGHEATLISKVVEKISLELRTINSEVDEKLVGIESRIKDILTSLEAGVEDVRMIGIKGIGGGGKTTLARAVFNKISFSFEGKSFVENVREASKASLSGLQEKILSKVLKDITFTVESVHDGEKLMKKMLCGKKVLLVLDDVDDLDQLEALAGGHDWFGPGSRIIITTRDEQVLIAHGVKWIRDVNLLSPEEAICLFSRYNTGGRDIPDQRYEQLSQKFVHYAAGLPLTIRVLGSFLCGKDEPEWKDALHRLETIPLKQTLEKLELSYSGLEDDYKEIFLDVACLMKGWDKEEATRALESCGFRARIGLRVLEQKSLITVSPYNELGMHDHLEEMARNIIRRSHPDEPSEHSRLWIAEEIADIFANGLVTEATRVITTNISSSPFGPNICSKLFSKGFGNMKKLRFLHVDTGRGYWFEKTEVGQNFPNTLQFLSWEHYPHWCLPKTFQANNLVALYLPGSKIKQIWEDGERKVLRNLRFLDLSYTHLTTLDFGLLPNLEWLKLDDCFGLGELQVPTGYLRRLVYLNLNEFWVPNSLSFIKHLKSLQVLDLSHTNVNLQDILPGHSNYSLVELDLSRNLFKELPASIGNLQKLVSIDLSWCGNLKSLPQSIYSLQCLKDLDLQGSGIEILSEDLGRLESLETLNLKLTCVRYLPDSICMLKHLRELNLRHCHIVKLPEKLGDLQFLEKLYLPLSISLLKDLTVVGFKSHTSPVLIERCQHYKRRFQSIHRRSQSTNVRPHGQLLTKLLAIKS